MLLRNGKNTEKIQITLAPELKAHGIPRFYHPLLPLLLFGRDNKFDDDDSDEEIVSLQIRPEVPTGILIEF